MNQLVQLKNENGNMYPITNVYIVEEYIGRDTQWRKWSDGFAEYWNIQYYNGAANFELYGSAYMWNHPFEFSFPEGLFTSSPCKNYCLNYNQYEYLWLSSNGYGSATESQDLYLMSAAGVNHSGLELQISCYAWGHWK